MAIGTRINTDKSVLFRSSVAKKPDYLFTAEMRVEYRQQAQALGIVLHII